MTTIERPHIDLIPSFNEFIDELRAHGETVWSPYVAVEGEEPTAFIDRLLARATTPEPPLVAESVYWGVVDGNVVGRISLRHRLNENLAKVGGHIGYEVRPSYRRRGIATEMLRQILITPEARSLGRLLLTCAPDNVASNKTILSNGGVLERVVFVEMVNGDRNHYWIDVLAK